MFSANQIAGFLNQLFLSEQSDETASFFAFRYKFTKIESCSKIYWVNMVKKGHSQSGHRTLKLIVSKKWTDGINWFFTCWYNKSRKVKSGFSGFWVGVIKNGHVLLVHETLKSAVSWEWIHEFSWFSECW